MISSDSNVLVGTIDAFRIRAKSLRWTAIFVMLLIVLVLSAGIAIFILAGRLVDSEAFETAVRQKQGQINEVNHRVDSLGQEISMQLSRLETKQEELIEDQKTQDFRAGTTRALHAEKERQVKYWEREIEELRSRRDRLEESKGDLEKELLQLEQVGIETSNKQEQLWRAVSAIATRIGSLIILLFLVKILVPLYRYNMKLAYYYDARADALGLLTNDSEEDRSVGTFESLVSTLSPSEIDFGPAPKSPSEEAVELAKQIIGSKLGK